MFRGGKICISDHFKPLWARNVPKFGIAHAMALGVSVHKLKLTSKLNLKFRFSIIPNLINLLSYAFEKLGPWLAVEIPDLISKGLIKHKDEQSTS